MRKKYKTSMIGARKHYDNVRSWYYSCWVNYYCFNCYPKSPRPKKRAMIKACRAISKAFPKEDAVYEEV